MSDHIWKPVEVVEDWGIYQLTYQNELGEEHIHLADYLCPSGNLHHYCWEGCSVDWPGCKMTCAVYAEIAEHELAEKEENNIIPPPNPFNFMLNHTMDIDEQNFYVEEFDTLDGTHWQISVDVHQQMLDYLDKETEDLL